MWIEEYENLEEAKQRELERAKEIKQYLSRQSEQLGEEKMKQAKDILDHMLNGFYSLGLPQWSQEDKDNQITFFETMMNRNEFDLKEMIYATISRYGEGILDGDRNWIAKVPYMYTFDCEYGEDVFYEDFLTIASAMSQGDFQISDIQEEDIDDETTQITFTYNQGNVHEIHAKICDDWFDIDVITALNEILEKENNSKYFFVFSGCPQMISLIYQSKEWIENAQKVTGVSFAMA
ncbi:hypothetical protein FACS189418_5660 [Clostridia bacterium]|nr:hypothetical protein FACS189418_5660 [Clostridia bacterium]